MTELHLTPAAKLRLALDLFESGVALMRCNLRRERPEADEDELVETAEAIEVFPGSVVPVAQRPGLLATKILASEDRRPQDLVDAHHLLERASPEEVQEARALLRRVEQRGFHRGKRLLDELDALLGS